MEQICQCELISCKIFMLGQCLLIQSEDPLEISFCLRDSGFVRRPETQLPVDGIRQSLGKNGVQWDSMRDLLLDHEFSADGLGSSREVALLDGAGLLEATVGLEVSVAGYEVCAR